MLKVSSSKKNSFTSGHSCLAFAISAATSSDERLRHGCPLNVCGHRQNVHCGGQPRVQILNLRSVRIVHDLSVVQERHPGNVCQRLALCVIDDGIVKFLAAN